MSLTSNTLIKAGCRQGRSCRGVRWTGKGNYSTHEFKPEKIAAGNEEPEKDLVITEVVEQTQTITKKVAAKVSTHS